MNQPNNYNKSKILYVDDETENLESFKALFRRDYDVFLAKSAHEALTILRTENIHVLVTDQRMPDMTGTGLLEEVAVEYPDVLRYMLTGYSDYDPLVDAINKGKVHGYFSKPLNTTKFLEHIEKDLEIYLLKEHSRRLLEELQESQAKLRHAHQLAQIGIWDWDRKSDRMSWSEELYRIAGFDPGRPTPIFADLSAFFGAESWESLKKAMDGTLATGEHYSLELKMIRPDNHLRWVYAVGGPIVDKHGEIKGLHGTFQDITERKILEAQLVHSQKLEALGRLAAGIAHEINTPTQYVNDNIEFLRRNCEDLLSICKASRSLSRAARVIPPSLEDMATLDALLVACDIDYLVEEIPCAITQAQEGLGRIISIVQSVKQFAHPSSADMALVDLNEAIKSNVTISRNEWKYVAELTIDLDKGLPSVTCIVGEINQVILNLIVNAAHAIDDAIKTNPERKGRITITTRQEGPWVEIRVADTGTGIPPEIRDKVFDPFFTSKKGFFDVSNGIDLVLEHEIAASLGGPKCVQKTSSPWAWA